MHERGESYDASWRGRPAGMLDADVPVWHRYLDRPTLAADRYFYNVRLTIEPLSQRFPNDLDRALAFQLLAKRIDAVGETPDSIVLFEVAAKAGPRTIGQLLTYRTLHAAEHPDDKREITLALVVEQIDADLTLSARVAGITVIRV